jgi:hypothetical protein
MSDDQALFTTATGTERTNLKMDCARCLNYDKFSATFSEQLQLFGTQLRSIIEAGTQVTPIMTDAVTEMIFADPQPLPLLLPP